MQIYVYKKQTDGRVIESFLQWNRDDENPFMSEPDLRGALFLLNEKENRIALEHLREAGFFSCTKPGRGVELFRSLLLDTKKNQGKPRWLKSSYSSAGAFKRSIRPFLRRFTSDHPACALFIPVKVFDVIVREHNENPQPSVSGDPLDLLVTGLSEEQAILQLASEFIGESANARLIRTMIYKASLSTSHVLILGESGTGKDIIARKIYEYAREYKAGFYPINCSAIPDSLFESELFGHIKGSFTDAKTDKQGLLKEADKGTVFLDEIGDLSVFNQAKILRAIESKKVRSIGRSEEENVDVRFIAATNRNLEYMIKRNLFREDLYYRLYEFVIMATPLRKQPEDIPLLANHFWSKIRDARPLSREFLAYLQKYPWPGNVRELKTLLNSLVDMLGVRSPRPVHVEALRQYRKDILLQATTEPQDQSEKELTLQCRNTLMQAMNILREIKIRIRPVISKRHDDNDISSFQGIVDYIKQENDKLEDLCREPLKLREWTLYERIKRFRYVLDKIIVKEGLSPKQLRNYWQNDIKILYEDIEKGIFRLIFEKVEM